MNIALEYLQRCQKYHDKWLKNKELDTPVLILDTNKDVNYDKDEGDEWITKISDFITERLQQESMSSIKTNAAGSPESKISETLRGWAIDFP